MLEKPFVLACALMVITYFIAIIVNQCFYMFQIINYGMVISISILLPAFYIGLSHTNKYKSVFPKKDRVKIALYFFTLQSALIITILLVMGANISVKGAPLYNVYILKPIFEVLFYNFTAAFIAYLLLAAGCALRLKFDKKTEQSAEVTQES